MRTLSNVLLAGLLLAAGPALAGPEAVSKVAGNKLPAKVKAKGKTVLEVWTWKDGDGSDAAAVFSATDSRDAELASRELFVQYFRGKRGKLSQQRLIRDWFRDCEFDLIVEVVAKSVAITDEDHDGVSELSFAYDLACTSDVSPMTRKLMVLEGKDKHALRGTSRVDDGSGPAGGEYQADPFRGAPELKALAERRWKELL